MPVILAIQHEDFIMGTVIESIHVSDQDQDLAARMRLLEQQMADIRPRVPDNKVSIILLSGDFDKAIAAFFMANGAAAMGMEVTMFFTFWGCTVIKKGRKLKGKKFMHKMINMMLPGSSRDLAPSKMSFGGIGRPLFNYMMKGQMSSLEEQIELAQELGITFQVCSPSLSIMGFDADEWVVPVDVCGVAAMYDTALNARTAYFIS
jgi:peroxiredoxin family protein